MVVDAVIYHWAMVVDGEDAWPEGLGRSVQNMATLFYVDSGILTSSHLTRLEEVLDILTVLFDRVGLQTNMEKMVGMVWQLYRTAGSQYEEAHTWRVTGKGLKYWARQGASCGPHTSANTNHTTLSTMILKIIGDAGSPFVTPRPILNSCPRNFPTLGKILCFSQ